MEIYDGRTVDVIKLLVDRALADIRLLTRDLNHVRSLLLIQLCHPLARGDLRVYNQIEQISAISCPQPFSLWEPSAYKWKGVQAVTDGLVGVSAQILHVPSFRFDFGLHVIPEGKASQPHSEKQAG